ncbi:unnamed protein product [Moneuplotes crassus]|uniref:Uncharacterized protein n=1 Tax=Euplotes crassus TaxID=5936 RepID=A0AAD2CY70_EUPCR|nr:unnamed protein product [Moneuplotes crassus]
MTNPTSFLAPVQPSDEKTTQREIWNIPLTYFFENTGWKSVMYMADQWSISIDMRIPNSSIIIKTFTLLEGAKFKEVSFFFTSNALFKESLVCFLDQDIKIDNLILIMSEIKLLKYNFYCLIRNAHKIKGSITFAGVEFGKRQLSLLLHAFRHVPEINMSKCSLHSSCEEMIRIDPFSIFCFKILDLKFTKGSKESLHSLIQSMAINPTITDNLEKIHYNEGIMGNKQGQGYSKDSIKSLLAKYGYKAKVRGLKAIRYK